MKQALPNNISVRLKDKHVMLFSEKAMIVNDALVISDVHFGKVNHFRKAGIPIPSKAIDANFETLASLIVTHKPRTVIFLGDLFHSDANHEWNLVASFLNDSAFNCKWMLIEGNHDILDQGFYHSAHLQVRPKLALDNLLLTHEPLENVPEGQLNVHGHIHPGVRLSGMAKQGLTLPCFHLSKHHFCLPAFGELTGLYKIKPKRNDKIWATLDNHILEV